MRRLYHRHQTTHDLIDHVVGKVLDMLKVKHNLYERWTGRTEALSAEESAQYQSEG